MFIITCPYCGPRDQSEFTCGGEAHISRPADPAACTDREWAAYVFLRTNPKGRYHERWVHGAGCRRWFNMIRNTATDEILAIYEMGAAPPEVTVNAPATPSGEADIGSGNDAVKIMRADETDPAREAAE